MKLFRRQTVDGITTDRTLRAVLVVLLTDAANLGGSTIWRLSRVRSSGHVHVRLAQLRAQGWVTTFPETPTPPDRLARTFHQLTPYGREQALRLLRLDDPSRTDPADDDKPTDGIAPITAPCGAQSCAEHDRAKTLEARLAVLQEANMAANRGPR